MQLDAVQLDRVAVRGHAAEARRAFNVGAFRQADRRGLFVLAVLTLKDGHEAHHDALLPRTHKIQNVGIEEHEVRLERRQERLEWLEHLNELLLHHFAAPRGEVQRLVAERLPLHDAVVQREQLRRGTEQMCVVLAEHLRELAHLDGQLLKLGEERRRLDERAAHLRQLADRAEAAATPRIFGGGTALVVCIIAH